MKIAIIGTQGIPAKYGGFETLVDNIVGDNCSPDIQYTVFCSSKDYQSKKKTYKGAILKYIPFHANGIQSTIYDICSMWQCRKSYDSILILGVSGCLFLPIFRLLSKSKLIINIDGLEHKREKWGKFAKWFLRTSESMAIKYANIIIADNIAIKDYVKSTYDKDAVYIAYGGDHAKIDISESKEKEILNHYNLKVNEYCFSVCRIEPENNCHITLNAFANNSSKVVFVGNWSRSPYGINLKQKYNKFSNILLLDAIYDQEVLFTLRKNCKLYIHGHSAGGTNPSLVEAMSIGVPIAAYDVIYNKETTKNKAIYFSDAVELRNIINNKEIDLSSNARNMKEIADEEYTWKIIAKEYEECYKIKSQI